MTRHIVADGKRDITWSVVVKNDFDEDYADAGVMDSVTQRIVMVGKNL